MSDPRATLEFRLIARDEQAFTELVEATRDRLGRICTRLVGPHDAGDLLQETYTRAWAGLLRGQFKLGGEGVVAWVTQIAINGARDALRRRKHSPTALSLQPQEPRALERVALGEALGLLDRLPAEQRVAVVLKDLEGHTSLEVAKLLSISEGAVEQRLVRARATLRAAWNPSDAQPVRGQNE